MGYLIKILGNGHYVINEVYWHNQVILRDDKFEENASTTQDVEHGDSTTFEAELEENCGNSRSIKIASKVLIDDLNSGQLSKIPNSEIGFESIRGHGVKNGHASYSWLSMLLPGASKAASSDDSKVLILRCCKTHMEKINYIAQRRIWVNSTTSIEP